ncbi:HMG (high mobility group) box protein with ARID/BRIGHT DNA-binding domain-containing protein [Rhynchospora pubera]|uniref:HMG (High mobility group) box protein with ARID/BRIGHT DNA-binding domain-containing protein n=1 Tax=Rhynchospora pubera TaxID=906938 RepID=A0AAV8D374_9POAL|nr:HMG (high mobility group) box protein with ARID/BRIGHT DNA-binding domain-containing protein [Rhynchospora pubera]
MKMSQKIKNNNAEKEKGLMEGGTGMENTNGNKNESYKLYPKPLAKYSDVMSNKELFMQTLEKFHLAMKTKFMIPIIGGKDLDLHKLFQEVTSRGGIEKVISDRRWKEVTASFTFPSTATNASFILRKYYYSLLYHFEKLYFFGSPGCSNTSDNNMPSPVAQCPSKRPLEATHDSPSVSQKRKIRNEPPPQANLDVTGVIDGKFEHGYFLTVKFGSQTLRGALYHCPDQPPPHSIVLPQPVNFNSSPAFTTSASNLRVGSRFASASTPPVLGARRQRRRRKRRPSTMDPNHPKPNRSGYNFFFAEQHAQLKPLHPGKDREISRMIGERWNSLTEIEKNVYQERGRVDKQRYQSELAVYRERQKTEPGTVISDAVPINQRPACESEFTVEGVDIKVEEGDLVLANNNEHNSDSEGTDESEDGDKNQDLDLDTGSVSGSGSESDTSHDARLVAVEFQPTDGVGPSRQTRADGFELRKREVAHVVEVEPKAAEDCSKSMEDVVKTDVKLSEGSNSPVKDDAKTAEVSNVPENDDIKMDESFNVPVKDDVKMDEGSNNLVDGGGKKVEAHDDPLHGNVEMVEGSDDPVEVVVKSGDDNRNPVDGDVKMVEAFNNAVSCNVKTGQDFSSPAVVDVTMGKPFCIPIESHTEMAAEVSKEEKLVDTA